MTRFRRSRASVLLLLLTGCSAELPPLGQIRLHLDTDAVLPPGPGEARLPGEPAPLFDTLRIDVYDPKEASPCAGCSRTFGVDRAMFMAGDVSFGLPLRPLVAGYRVRLRLFDSHATLTGDVPEARADCAAPCPPPSVIEVVAALPVVGEEGILDVPVTLLVDEVGLPRGTLEAPVPLAPDASATSLVGSWPGARILPCSDEPGPGEVCVPGGAFWMGNPAALGLGIGDAADERRLVVVSPFFIGAHEVTVASYRAVIDALDPADRASLVPILFSGNDEGNDWRDYCTFSEAPGPQEDDPVVCVGRDQAQAYCGLVGGTLPTEAQLEYVASGLEGKLFVWGSDVPDCEDAVLARYGYGLFGGDTSQCTPDVAPGGTEPVGSSLTEPRRDRLSLPSGTVYDLVGNATEWARDVWNRQTEPCWSAGGVYRDPLCQSESPTDGLLYVFRLGSYAVGARQAMAAYRGGLIDVSFGNGIDLGFRCVRPADFSR